MKAMKGELAAIIAKAPEDGYWAICPEIPAPMGKEKTHLIPRAQ